MKKAEMRVIWRLRHLEVHLAAAKASSCLRAAAAAPGPSGLPQAAVTQKSRARDTPGALRTIAPGRGGHRAAGWLQAPG